MKIDIIKCMREDRGLAIATGVGAVTGCVLAYSVLSWGYIVLPVWLAACLESIVTMSARLFLAVIGIVSIAATGYLAAGIWSFIGAAIGIMWHLHWRTVGWSPARVRKRVPMAVGIMSLALIVYIMQGAMILVLGLARRASPGPAVAGISASTGVWLPPGTKVLASQESCFLDPLLLAKLEINDHDYDEFLFRLKSRQIWWIDRSIPDEVLDRAHYCSWWDPKRTPDTTIIEIKRHNPSWLPELVLVIDRSGSDRKIRIHLYDQDVPFGVHQNDE